MAGEPTYTASILRDRADLRRRRPTRIQMQELAARHHGTEVRAIVVVRDVESVAPGGTGAIVRITAYDEEGGEPIRLEADATYLERATAGGTPSRFQLWAKGQKVVVEGVLDWPDAEAMLVVRVAHVRFEGSGA